MAGQNKRKKHHDKDKYYKLAKEQGLRSRAAFKLSQMNRKYNILNPATTKVVLDLCAAPGGWTQVASRTLPVQGSIIVAVDLLPIRSLHRSNVLTLVGDITTDKCRADIRRELQSAAVDVVLCDGAPNVGSAYEKDAYVQNEIALSALRCATEHLKKRGTFVTKLYRSRDYAAYVWVAHQLFDTVEAVKPSSSRSQSAEIFLVCGGYKKPDKLDPKMLDPKCVFEDTTADYNNATTDGTGNSKTDVNNIFHKSFFEHRRQRQGYDMEKMDFTHRNMGTIKSFMDAPTIADAVQMLGDKTGLVFSSECHLYRDHPLTTDEIKYCLTDLKVLNRSDFKGILNWRLKVNESLQKQAEGDDNNDNDEEEADPAGIANPDSSDEESVIQDEISKLRLQKLREAKRKKKKEREIKAKRRRRRAMALDITEEMENNHDKIFSLSQMKSREDLELVREVDLDKTELDHDDERNNSDDDGTVSSQGDHSDEDEKTGYSYRLDRELDNAYDSYLQKTKNKEAKSGTKMDKRRRVRDKIKETKGKDDGIMESLDLETNMDDETKRYAQLLQAGPGGDDDSDKDTDNDASDSEESDDGYHETPVTPEEHAASKSNIESGQDKSKSTTYKDSKNSNPLIVQLPEEGASVRAARWFSNPLFQNIASVAVNSSSKSSKMGASEKNAAATMDGDDYDSEDNGDNNNNDVIEVAHIGSDDDDDEDVDMDKPTSRRGPVASKKNKKKQQKAGRKIDDPDRKMTAEEILASIPRTDKQIRHERRVKALGRAERKKKRVAKAAGEEEGDFEIVSNNTQKKTNDDDDDGKHKKTEEQRALLKAGLGTSHRNKDDDKNTPFTIAPQTSNLPPKLDTRVYDSENELYDSDDQARTLSLATMTLRHSKRKALVDASYNRFAWNDPSDLPDWFVDDESKNYRPQLPIPKELMDKMKERYLQLSMKPIAKVAEARARKSRQVKSRLTAAKKKAEAVGNSEEMTEAGKLRAISKAMRGNDAKRPSKTYVVSKKNGSTKGSKGVKLVDRRMRQDKRSLERAAKKRKGGKQGGMTGSKKRRSHS